MALEVKLKTLTPLYTGGADGKCDRVHETGLLGSLRWWYEAFVRGLGGAVCDPTSDRLDGRCPRDGDHYCRVCGLFGATGHSRKFRLRVGHGQALFGDATHEHRIPLPSGRIHGKPEPRAGGWYLMGGSIMGEDIPLRLVSLSACDVPDDLRPIFALIHRHAAFGAKVSNGYGVVQFSEGGQPIQACVPDSLTDGSRLPRTSELPDIRDFFFAKLRFQAPMRSANWWQKTEGIAQAWDGLVQDSQSRVYVHGNHEAHQRARRSLQYVIQEKGLLPLAPAIRNWLRYHWHSSLSVSQKDYLFGTTRPVCPFCCRSGFSQDKRAERNYFCPSCHSSFAKGQELERIASKLNISHAYRLDNHDWEFRVWGWIPSTLPSRLGLNRDHFLADLQSTLMNAATWLWVFGGSSPAPTLVEWHALDCHLQDGMAYLRELLGLDRGGAS